MKLIVGMYDRELTNWGKSIALPKMYKKVRTNSTYVQVQTLQSASVSDRYNSFFLIVPCSG